jgi:sulfotransferase family protein
MGCSAVLTQMEKAWANWIAVPPVFIVGCPRSGTTLLRLMLSAHPRIWISSEGAYVRLLRSELSSYGDLSDNDNLRALYQDILPFLEFENFLGTPPFDQFADWVKRFGADERSIITFYGTWEARLVGKTELTWWGDNAPDHVDHLPYLEKLFPESKFIVMIRDPRDVWASSKVAFKWDLLKVMKKWERSVVNGLGAESRLGPARVRWVGYDDLVTAPRDQLRGLSKFLGVEYTERMLDYPESTAAEAVSRKKHHKNLLRPVFPDSVGRYRQTLTQEEIAAIQRWLFWPMQWLGYIA